MQATAPVVLLVEDSAADTYLVRQSLRKHLKDFVLRVVDDGEKAFHLIEATESDESLPCPALFLLDLNLPKRTGHEVLQRLKKSAKCSHVPVVILTSSDSPVDRAETTRLGATAYFRKPPDLEAFMRIGEVVQNILGQ
ncbi:MAG TPA: response regulator [Bryobacteraceae bacterium]|nr:response regulator [Bryobacteraceae bacterium]